VQMDPQIGHPTCDLDRQRRIREARSDVIGRALTGRHGRRSLLDRLLRRPARHGPAELDPGSLVDRGDDVWHSLRF
jgi:hypothetical protein